MAAGISRRRVGPVINVLDPRYGIAADDRVDATAGIRAAARDLAAAGGGTLHFPKRRYRVLDEAGTPRGGNATGPLASFSALPDVRIAGDGSVFDVAASGARRVRPLFSLTNCRRVGVEGFSVEAPVHPWRDRTGGIVGVTLRGTTTEAALRGISTIGCRALLTVESDGTAGRAQNLLLHDLRASNGAYGLAFMRNGDSVRATEVATDDVLRSYIAYGVRNHDLRIASRNNKADDCMLRGYNGMTLENIRLRYTNTQSTDAASAAPCVSIAPAWSGVASERPSTFRSIDVTVDVRYGARGFPGHGISVYKSLGDTDRNLDPRARGYVLEHIRLSGRVEGNPGPDNSWPFLFRNAPGQASWGAGDIMRNWTIEDFTLVGTSSCWFGFGDALRGGAIFRRVRSDGHVYISGNEEAPITVMDSRAASLCASRADRSAISYVDCEILYDEFQSRTNKRFIRTKVAGRFAGDE